LFGKGEPVQVHVRSLADQMTFRVRPALLVLQVGVALLLLIACANVANLFLSRGIAREREIGIRVALGAGRNRLIRETLSESFVIAGVGGVLGIGMAWGLVRLLPLLTADNFPRLDSIQLDWPALVVALLVTASAGVLAGLAPALRGTRLPMLPALREGVGVSASRRANFLRRGLLVAEASFAILLLVGATLLGRSFVNLTGTDAGYDATNVLTARIYLRGAPRGEADTNAFVPQLLDRVRRLPGVIAAGAANMAPMGRSTFVSGFEVPGANGQPVFARAVWYVVTPGYAEALRLSLRAGRILGERDLTSGVQGMLVNESFVRTFLPGVEPIGLRFQSVQTSDERPAEIVGVVANVLKDSLDQQPQPEVYVLATAGVTIRREIYLILRSADRPAGHAEDVRRIVSDLSPDAAVDGMEPLSLQLANSVAEPRFSMMVLLSMAGLALVLAAIGLYGVLSYSVARRQREIGIRTALGATRAAILAMVIREGMLVAVLGLTLGIAIAAASTRLMQSLLIGVEPLDELSFALASVALLAVALVACAAPAFRAAAADPLSALRRE